VSFGVLWVCWVWELVVVGFLGGEGGGRGKRCDGGWLEGER